MSFTLCEAASNVFYLIISSLQHISGQKVQYVTTVSTLHQSLVLLRVLPGVLKMQSPDCFVCRLFLRVLFAENNLDRSGNVSPLDKQ